MIQLKSLTQKRWCLLCMKYYNKTINSSMVRINVSWLIFYLHCHIIHGKILYSKPSPYIAEYLHSLNSQIFKMLITVYHFFNIELQHFLMFKFFNTPTHNIYPHPWPISNALPLNYILWIPSSKHVHISETFHYLMIRSNH